MAAPGATGGREAAGPRLSGLSSRALGVAPIRLALGAAAIAAALAQGLDSLPAFGAAAAGAILFALMALGQGSRASLREAPDPLPVPPGARFDPAWQAALRACLPSTLGVTTMTVIALFVSAALVAALAGVLLSMGVFALVSGLELAARERRESVRIWLEHGPRPRRFVDVR